MLVLFVQKTVRVLAVELEENLLSASLHMGQSNPGTLRFCVGSLFPPTLDRVFSLVSRRMLFALYTFHTKSTRWPHSSTVPRLRPFFARMFPCSLEITD